MLHTEGRSLRHGERHKALTSSHSGPKRHDRETQTQRTRSPSPPLLDKCKNYSVEKDYLLESELQKQQRTLRRVGFR